MGVNRDKKQKFESASYNTQGLLKRFLNQPVIGVSEAFHCRETFENET